MDIVGETVDYFASGLKYFRIFFFIINEKKSNFNFYSSYTEFFFLRNRFDFQLCYYEKFEKSV